MNLLEEEIIRSACTCLKLEEKNYDLNYVQAYLYIIKNHYVVLMELSTYNVFILNTFN